MRIHALGPSALLLASGGGSATPISPGAPDAPPVSMSSPDAPPVSSCGSGTLDPGEGYEVDADCSRRESCSSHCTCVALDPPPADTSQVLIDDAYRAGTIDVGTALLYRAYAIFHDPRLPADDDGVGPDPEDGTLPFAVARAMATLSPAQLDALTPYLVRPSDPRSLFSVGIGAPAPVRPGTPPPDPCTLVACHDWQSVTTAHFRVWTCGTATLPEATGVASDAESIFDPEIAIMGPPEVDDFDNVMNHDPTTDIYLLDLNQGRTRNGNCVLINENNEDGLTIPDLEGVITHVGGTAPAFINAATDGNTYAWSFTK